MIETFRRALALEIDTVYHLFECKLNMSSAYKLVTEPSSLDEQEILNKIEEEFKKLDTASYLSSERCASSMENALSKMRFTKLKNLTEKTSYLAPIIQRAILDPLVVKEEKDGVDFNEEEEEEFETRLEAMARGGCKKMLENFKD